MKLNSFLALLLAGLLATTATADRDAFFASQPELAPAEADLAPPPIDSVIAPPAEHAVAPPVDQPIAPPAVTKEYYPQMMPQTYGYAGVPVYGQPSGCCDQPNPCCANLWDGYCAQKRCGRGFGFGSHGCRARTTCSPATTCSPKGGCTQKGFLGGPAACGQKGSCTQKTTCAPPAACHQKFGRLRAPMTCGAKTCAPTTTCAPMTCGPKTCAPRTCGRKSFAPMTCGAKACAPMTCGPKTCGPATCRPRTCAQKSCGLRMFGAKTCGPATCAPMTCGPKTCGPMNSIQKGDCGPSQKSCGPTFGGGLFSRMHFRGGWGGDCSCDVVCDTCSPGPVWGTSQKSYYEPAPKHYPGPVQEYKSAPAMEYAPQDQLVPEPPVETTPVSTDRAASRWMPELRTVSFSSGVEF